MAEDWTRQTGAYIPAMSKVGSAYSAYFFKDYIFCIFSIFIAYFAYFWQHMSFSIEMTYFAYFITYYAYFITGPAVHIPPPTSVTAALCLITTCAWKVSRFPSHLEGGRSSVAHRDERKPSQYGGNWNNIQDLS
jgi:hypothetical protein